jgi:HK97 family phage major capsid protein
MDTLVRASLKQINNLSGEALQGEQRVNSTPRTGYLGLPFRDVRDYSFTRGVTNKVLVAPGEDEIVSIETEIDKDLKRIFTPTFEKSLMVPADILYRNMDTSPGAKGGYSVGNTITGFIDSVRAVSLLTRLGAQGLTGAQGNLMFPRLISGSPVHWLEPGVSLSDDPPVFGQFLSAPKIAATFTEISEQLLNQISPETDAFIMSSFGRGLGAELDRVGLVGTGGAQILGIANTPGINASVSGTVLSNDGILDLMKNVSEAKGVQNVDALGFVSTPAVARLLKGRQRFTNGDTPIWQGGIAAGNIEGVQAYGTPAMDTAKLLYGDFSNVLIIDWGVLEIDLNRSGTLFNRGMVGLRAMWRVDVLVLHPESFGVIKSIS